MIHAIGTGASFINFSYYKVSKISILRKPYNRVKFSGRLAAFAVWVW